MGIHVIAGLGNPGAGYEKTRHNAGFQALDRLADKMSIRVNKRGFSGIYGEGVRNGEKVLLIKPTTYMNLSGDCVQAILHFYKIPLENLTVLYDDIELPVGALRIRANGSAGTHNGMRSIIACVGGDQFPRIRIGVGDQRKGELADYVLGKPGKEEQEQLDAAFDAAADAALLIVDGKIGQAQGKYNKKHQGSVSHGDAAAENNGDTAS